MRFSGVRARGLEFKASLQQETQKNERLQDFEKFWSGVCLFLGKSKKKITQCRASQPLLPLLGLLPCKLCGFSVFINFILILWGVQHLSPYSYTVSPQPLPYPVTKSTCQRVFYAFIIRYVLAGYVSVRDLPCHLCSVCIDVGIDSLLNHTVILFLLDWAAWLLGCWAGLGSVGFLSNFNSFSLYYTFIQEFETDI